MSTDQSGSGPDRFQIRLACPQDTADIARFNNAMAKETESRSLAEEIVGAGVGAVFSSDDKGFYVVAEHGGEVVGALMVTYEWSDWRNGFFWWIQSVYVEPKFRRRGIYRLLYQFVIQRARSAGNVYGFRLYVDRDNSIAQKVYESLGMCKTDYLIFEQGLGI
ncbi:MAG TPA: GNAT family N-acetyltransferase [Gammaproteobacteria bacterium]|nr:GNAT family N-acetyltransferase [Gammaproteobacteria bacterium]